MRVTLKDYLMGREVIFPEEYTPEVEANAEKTVEAVNSLLAVLEAEGIPLEENKQGSIINSGWRPPQINGQVKNAAVKSKHMTGEACDLYDPEGAIDDFLMSEAGQRVLIGLRLFLEHPSATKNWSHVQIVPPRSLNRVFYP